MTKPFSELRKQMTPERRAENKIRAQLALLHLALAELPKSVRVTQDNTGKNLDIVESTLSQLENQDDIQVSTLFRYIKAFGGSLKLVAHFPDKEIILSQFE